MERIFTNSGLALKSPATTTSSCDTGIINKDSQCDRASHDTATVGQNKFTSNSPYTDKVEINRTLNPRKCYDIIDLFGPPPIPTEETILLRVDSEPVFRGPGGWFRAVEGEPLVWVAADFETAQLHSRLDSRTVFLKTSTCLVFA